MEGTLEIKLPDVRPKREELLSEMIRLMAVDGQLAAMEKHLCATASGADGFHHDEFKSILDKVLAASPEPR
jgi:hypothetical protein